MEEKLWTFIIEYNGGTYISQFANMSLLMAIREYNETDPSGQGAIPLDEDYTQIKGVAAVFFLSGESKTLFGNAVLTAQ